MNSLKFSASEKGIVVTGKTFDVKEILKAKGASWDPDSAAWIFRGKTMQAVFDLLTAEVEAAKARLKARPKTRLNTPEGLRSRVVAAKAEGAYWICCDDATVIDWRQKTTTCDKHNFRVRGCYYTGD